MEGIFLEINLRKIKFLLFGGYRSDHPKYGIGKEIFLKQLTSAVDKYNAYDKFLLAGDFNIPNNDEVLEDFMADLDCKCLVKEPTCFKSNENPSKIDLFITNFPLSFQNTTAIDTGLSDFHRMIVTVMKNAMPKSQPKEIQYRNLNTIDNAIFDNCLRDKLQELTDKNYEEFEKFVLEELDKVAPVKTKKSELTTNRL